MHGGTLCVVHANHDFETIDVPVSQGSTRIVYAPLVDLKSGVDGCASGENMRRKLASAFKCLTVSDMADWGRDHSGQAPPPEATKQSGHYQLVFCSGRFAVVDVGSLAGWAEKGGAPAKRRERSRDGGFLLQGRIQRSGSGAGRACTSA